MTEVLEAPVEASGTDDRATDAARRRGGGWSRWRVAARLARRQVWRAKWSSVLVVALIALPIAAMSAYSVYAMSSVGTPDEQIAVELGAMQAWVAPVGVPDAGFWQAPTQPDWNGYPASEDGAWEMPEGAPLEDPLGSLPRGTEAIELTHGEATVETVGGTARLEAWGGPAWDPRFEGRFDLAEGVRATAPGEAMVTEAALERLGIAIGGELSLADAERPETFTVVGTLDAATLPDSAAAVFLADAALVAGEQRWYLPTLSLAWSDVAELNEEGIVAYSREVVLDPPTVTTVEAANAHQVWLSSIWMTLTVLAVAGVFAAYVAVMLAGAAFAVSARRQQRSLAVAASVGARPRDLARTIALQGTTLGVIGGVLGVAAGIGVGAVVMGLTTTGSATQYWGFHVPWPVLAGVFVFAVLVGTASALLPARTVTRTDTISALRGARRPQAPRASRPVWGSVLLVAGTAIALGSGLAAAALHTMPDVPLDSPLRAIPPFGIVIGPILVQIGVLVSGGWLLWWTSRGLSKIGLAARIASRDAAANASRPVPAFAAIAATVFIGVFALGQSSMQTADTARTWFYQAPLGSLAIDVMPPGMDAVPPADAELATRAAVELAEGIGARDAAVISRQSNAWFTANSQNGADAEFAMALMPDRYLLDPSVENSFSTMGQSPQNPLSVVDPRDLETALGISLSPSDLAAYRDGAALAADPRYVTDGAVQVAAWPVSDASEGRAPDNIWDPAKRPADWGMPEVSEPLWTTDIEAVVVDLPRQPISIAISPATAAGLGIVAQPESVIASFAVPPQTVELDRLMEQASMAGTADWALAPRYESGPPSDAAWVIPVLVTVAVLVLGASAVALGLARFERRPDDATLTAVGGTRGLRRRIGFWQGLVIAGFGTIAGTAAGILPPIGFAIQSQTDLRVEDIPWWLIASLAVGLPLAIAAVSWLVPPRHPDLTRRTAIT
ncbi:FtsX-like permease family protein [Microbacterium sp. I2]|uniref:ABC transporter permease n=1 Tax=Microbacterium sp. I2 TaxID=3391826 RepID=UPI003ED9BC36